MLLDGSEEMPEFRMMRTTASFADGAPITDDDGWLMVWFPVTAPQTSAQVDAVSTITLDEELTLTFNVSGVLPVGAGADTEPPAAPTGLAARTEGQSIVFSWDANREADLAGYRLVRTDAQGVNDTLLGTYSACGAALTADAEAWGEGPWYFAVKACDRSGNESPKSASVTVQDPSLTFFGTPAVTASAGTLADGVLTLDERNEGTLTFSFTPDGGVTERPDAVSVLLRWTDTEGQTNETPLSLPRSAGYRGDFPIPEDFAELKKATFTASTGGRERTVGTLTETVSAAAHVRILLPTEEYPLAARTESLTLVVGMLSRRETEKTDDGFTAVLERRLYRTTEPEILLMGEDFECGVRLDAIAQGGDTFALPAGAMPDAFGVRVQTEQELYCDPVLTAYALTGNGDQYVSNVWDERSGEAEQSFLFLREPGQDFDTVRLELRLQDNWDGEMGFYPTEGAELLDPEGIPFVPGALCTLRGTQRVADMPNYMYAEVFSGENGDAPAEQNVLLTLTDEDGTSVLETWHRRTKQLDTGLLTAGKTYRVSAEYFDVPDAELTILREGENRESPAVIRLYETAQISFDIAFHMDALDRPDFTQYYDTVLPQELTVSYKNRAGEWTALTGRTDEHVALYIPMTAETAAYAAGFADGMAVSFTAEPVPLRDIDTDAGLRIDLGTEGRFVDSFEINSYCYVSPSDPARIRSGQTLYTAGSAADGLRMDSALNLFDRARPDEYSYYYRPALRWTVADQSKYEEDTQVPAISVGLRMAQTPQVRMHYTRTVERGDATFLFRSRTDGRVYRFVREQVYRSSGLYETFRFETLPYGEYDLLFYYGGGTEADQLERRLRMGEESLTVPPTVSGLFVSGLVLNEDSALIGLDTPPTAVDTSLPGLQGVTVLASQADGMPGDRASFAVHFTCVPGADEEDRTVTLTCRGTFTPDGVSVSVTRPDGTRLTAQAEGTDRVVIPASDELLTGTVTVTGIITDDGRSSGVTLDAVVPTPYGDMLYSDFIRLVLFTGSLKEERGKAECVLNGRAQSNSELTVRVTSQTDPARTAEQTVPVSRYGYWKCAAAYPVADANTGDSFTVQVFDGAGTLQKEWQTQYVPGGVIPSVVRLRYRFNETEREIVAYPDANRSFEALDRAVMTFGSNYGHTAMELELTFDDTNEDGEGMTDARRVYAPVLALGYGLEETEPLFLPMTPKDMRTFEYTNEEQGFDHEELAYATTWVARFRDYQYTQMAVDYQVSGETEPVQARREITFADAQEMLGLDETQTEEFAQSMAALAAAVEEAGGTLTGSTEARATLKNFTFEGITDPDSEEQTYLLPPAEARDYNLLGEYETVIRPFDGELPEDEGTKFRSQTGEGFLLYTSVKTEPRLTANPDGTADLVIETVTQVIFDVSQLTASPLLLMDAAPQSGKFALSDRATNTMFGVASDVSGEVVDHFNEAVKATDPGLAKINDGVKTGLGGVINTLGVGKTAYDEITQEHRQGIRAIIQDYKNRLSALRSSLSRLCNCPGEPDATATSELNRRDRQGQAELDDIWLRIMDENLLDGVVAIGASAASFVEVPFLGTAIGHLTDMVRESTDEWSDFTAERDAELVFQKWENSLRAAVAACDNERCKEDPEEEFTRPASYFDDETLEFLGRLRMSPKRIIDPSGTVYEAMLSNPLAGVTVTIEQWDGAAWTEWTDAPDYNDQQSAYVTEESGFYRWDVPDGKWRVRYEKEGYNGGEPVYSAEMDVPPVWLDVNQNMTNPDPASAEATAKDGVVTVKFTRPVLAADVTAASLRLLADDVPTDAAAQAVLTEGELTLTCTFPLEPEDGVTYSVDAAEIRTYAGTPSTFRVPVTVAPAEDPNTVAAVQADVESGSTVTAGTQITLSTATEGAEIWYTLDGSCPCVEGGTRIRYEGPVTVTEDCYLIAFAVKEGLADSVTRGFVYYCGQTPVSPVTGEMSADAHSVTAVVNVDLTGVDGWCDVLFSYYSAGRFVGQIRESYVNADGQDSVSLAKRFVSAEELTDVTLKILVLRSGRWIPLLPAEALTD